MPYLALFASLPTHAGTSRVRLWRSLKAMGCVSLREGVYLLPERPELAARFDAVIEEIVAAGGQAEVYRLQGRNTHQEVRLQGLFDRSADYAAIVREAAALLARLEAEPAAALTRPVRALRRRYEEVAACDYFPTPAKVQADEGVQALERRLAERLAPDEPHSVSAPIPALDPAHYRGRLWATRRDLWVDRLACAWLILRHIDPQARFLWLAAPGQCPPQALGFDFDGAAFSHVGPRVSFETLLAAFGLEVDAGLRRIGALVHALDLGGPAPPEAGGLVSLLRGLKLLTRDDDALLARACPLFDALYASFAEENGMDASRPASAEHELPTALVAFGREGSAAPGAVDNSAAVVG